MPCACYYPDDDYTPPKPPKDNVKNSKAYKSLKEEFIKFANKYKDIQTNYNSLKHECDTVTQLLCYASGLIRTNGISVDCRFVNWMTKHDKFDIERSVKVLHEKYPYQHPTKEDARHQFIEEAEKVHPLSSYHRTVFFDIIWDIFIKEIEAKEFKRNEIEKIENSINELQKKLTKLKSES